MFKKLTALLLVLVLLIGLVPAASAAPQTTVDSSDVSIEGTNGFGSLLSQEIAESQTEAAEESSEYPGGYTVTDLEIADGVATVTYDSMEEATLVVALYTEDGMQMVTSAKATVTPDETTATVTFEGDMPEYFLASAYLLDSYDLSPLCAAYDTPMYTREMQELLASTVDDYAPEKILNLDEDETTNFAVYADTTIVIEAVEGKNTVASVDEENATYVIKDADEQFTSLVEGNVFVYPYAENEILIVKIADIQVDGTTVVITGAELELEEVFSHMKVEGSGNNEDMTVDDTTAAEGITYVGLVEEEVPPQAWEGSGSATASHEFKIELKNKLESDYIDASVSVTGSLNFSIRVSLNFYVSVSRQFVEFRADPSVKLGVTIQGNITGKYPIGDFGFSPVAGVYVGFAPEIQLEYNGVTTLSVELSTTIGVAYSSDKGVDNLCTKPKVKVDLSVEGKLFFGVDFVPNARILSESVASLKLTAEVGFELTAKMSGTDYAIYESNAESIHTCRSCLGLDVDFKAELGGTLQFLKCKWLTIEISPLKLTFDLGEWYKSSEASGFKTGTCENWVYRITVQAKDEKNAPLKNAAVTIGDLSDSTNSKGTAVFYLPMGDYTITVTDGALTKHKAISVDAAKKVTIGLVEEDEAINNDLINLIFDKWTVADTIVVSENEYDGHTYQIIDSHMTWIEAKAYCESMGGYLATITSQEESDVIVSMLKNHSPRNCYWIGLHRDTVSSPWKWVTDEAYDFRDWAANEPNNDDGEGELYVHLFGVKYTGGKGIKYPGDWNDAANEGAGYASSFYSLNNFGFICEFGEIKAEDSITTTSHDRIINNEESVPTETTGYLAPAAQTNSAVDINAVYPGDYGTEITDTYTLKTAAFKDLVPGEQYVLLAMASIEVDDPLVSDNLLFIDQAEALEDGTLVFQYVQRTPCDISYVVACGASHKNLKDAGITFPEMTADGELQVVDPVVVYDGETLVEGRDYVIVGTVDFTEPGEYVCSIRGIHNYTGLVECHYTVTAPFTVVASGWSGATEWTLSSNGTLTVFGSGNMKNYGYNGGQPWLGKGVDVTRVIIEEGVAAVGTGAFRNLTTLESVTLPETGLTKIGEAAFYGCASLTDITIPDTIYTIWAYTFKNCSALASVKLSKSLIKIDQGAFEGCTSLPYIYIPGETEIIGSWGFKGCTGLAEADMTWANATEVREGAFKNCSALTTIHLPMDVQAFGDSAFYGIGAKSFTVPETVTTVGPWCFARAALTEITFEGDAPAIGEGAFNKITLTACYPGDNATWTADLMQNYGGTVTWTAR